MYPLCNLVESPGKIDIALKILCSLIAYHSNSIDIKKILLNDLVKFLNPIYSLYTRGMYIIYIIY